jgi:hypothetical protein
MGGAQKRDQGLSLADPEGVAMPERSHTPVEGLALLEGYGCDDCVYACASEDSMTVYHKTKHGWYKARAQRWVARMVTTWFNSPNRSYSDAGARQ